MQLFKNEKLKKMKRLILLQFRVEVMEQADFPFQSVSPIVLCSPSCCNGPVNWCLCWLATSVPLSCHFTAASFLLPVLSQAVCEENVHVARPSGGSCSTWGGHVGLFSIRQGWHLRPGNRKRVGGREKESGARDGEGWREGERKKEHKKKPGVPQSS